MVLITLYSSFTDFIICHLFIICHVPHLCVPIVLFVAFQSPVPSLPPAEVNCMVICLPSDIRWQATCASEAPDKLFRLKDAQVPLIRDSD